ncbi:DUF6153 family protein [Streptomyces sp. NBC_01278]|uniref:DUF6153 family protein n=1 Tax=Streptomyces sp. NBC_01278 TaxID=2903809 RepID=UPI002E33329F|nr:DUF6153 family protein [Streptomyces sp. NBC_01278]
MAGHEPRAQPQSRPVPRLGPDQMCTSAALPGAPGAATPDTAALAGMPSGLVHAQPAPSLALAHEPAGGRAPPSLADLQVLRT